MNTTSKLIPNLENQIYQGIKDGCFSSAKTGRKTNKSEVPLEIVISILAFIPFNDIKKIYDLGLVNKTWLKATKSSLLPNFRLDEINLKKINNSINEIAEKIKKIEKPDHDSKANSYKFHMELEETVTKQFEITITEQIKSTSYQSEGTRHEGPQGSYFITNRYTLYRYHIDSYIVTAFCFYANSTLRKSDLTADKIAAITTKKINDELYWKNWKKQCIII